MASVRDSAEVKLVGFEQGVNVKTIEQMLSQTRARFHPLANPNVVITHKSDKKSSYSLRVKSIPTDMGPGHYTLHVQSCKGEPHDLKIKVVGDTAATSVLTVNGTVTSIGVLHGKTFTLSDNNKQYVSIPYITFTIDATSSSNTRDSSNNWNIGISDTSGADLRTAIAAQIYDALFQAHLDGDLEITPVLDGQTIKLTQDNGGTRGNYTPIGSAISDGYISIPAFTGGKLGEVRTLNIGDKMHPVDTTMFALGMRDPPGYYPDEKTTGVAEPYTDTFNSDEQKIKRTTFDINRIINYNSVSTGITSRIVFDDTLLIVQDHHNSLVNVGSLHEGVKYEIVSTFTRNEFGAPGPRTDFTKTPFFASSNAAGTTFTVPASSGTNLGSGTGVVKVHLDSAIGKKLFQDGLDTTNPAFATGSFGLENWKMIAKDSGDVMFHDLVTDGRRWSSSTRDTSVFFQCPDLEASNAPDTVFMSIKYTTFNDRIPTVDTNQPDDSFLINFNISPRLKAIKDYSISFDTERKSTEVRINPFAPSSNIKRRFMNLFKELLDKLTKATPLNFVLKTVSEANFQYTISIFETTTKLTSIEISMTEGLVSSDKSTYFSFMRDDVTGFFESGNASTLSSPGSFNQDSKKIYLSSNEALYTPIISPHVPNPAIKVNDKDSLRKRKEYKILSVASTTNWKALGASSNSPNVGEVFVATSVIEGDNGGVLGGGTDGTNHGTVQEMFPVNAYHIGTKGVQNAHDLKNRVYDTIALAVSDGNLKVTPAINHAAASIKVEDADTAAHGTTALNSISLTSTSDLAKTYTIVHGGSSGNKAIQTGEIIRQGSSYADGSTVSGGHASIGTVAVNIKSTAKRRDVLLELAKAINSENGHNAGNSDSVIYIGGVNSAGDDPSTIQHLNMKQVVGGTAGNNNITDSLPAAYEVSGFSGANDYISSKSVKLTSLHGDAYPNWGGNGVEAMEGLGFRSFDNVYNIEDFSAPVFNIELRDPGPGLSHYIKPNHDVEVRSFGFGKRTSDLKFYDDLSMNGPRLVSGDYPNTLDIDPVFFLTASPHVRFPVQVNNLGNILGFETDGTIEPLDIRTLMLERNTAEAPMRGLKGEMGGEYSFSSIRNEACLIHNKINFEEAKNVAFFDNCPTVTELVVQNGQALIQYTDLDATQQANNVFYARVPGIIFKNDARIRPYIDTEERIFQANPLNGNNPESNEIDKLVLQVQELNHIDDTNLGAENFRRRAGFDFSSPHPGTDSIAFGGLRYV